MLLKEEQD